MRGLLTALPGQDGEAAAAWRARSASLVRPAGGLGALEAFGPWLAATRGTVAPRLDRPRVALFAAAHGIGAGLPGGLGVAPVAAEIARINATAHPTTALAASMDAELRLYELALEHPSADSSIGPAMVEQDAARAMAYGMMAVDDGVDLVVLASCSAGEEPAIAGLAAGLLGDAGLAGTWLDGAEAGRLASHAAGRGLATGEASGFGLMAELGGYDVAAMAGALIAAGIARVPVLLDGAGAMAAASVLERERPGSAAHAMPAQAPTTALEAALMQALKRPAGVYPGDTRLGRGAAGALAIPLLRALVRVQGDTERFGG